MRAKFLVVDEDLFELDPLRVESPPGDQHRMIGDGHRPQERDREQQFQLYRDAGQSGHQSEHQRDHRVADLDPGDLVRTQPDDRKDGEQSETDPDGHRRGGGQRCSDDEHAHVEREVCDRLIATPVATQIDPEHEQ